MLDFVRLVGKRFPLKRQAKLLASVVPVKYWFDAAKCMAGLQGLLAGLRGGNRTLTKAVMLDNWIRELTFSGAYPIAWRCEGANLLERPSESGTLHCWIHLPLMEMPLRALVELGHKPDLMVAHQGRIVAGDGFLVPGLAERVRAIAPGGQALVRARTVLRAGGSVACLADPEMGAPLSPAILRLAGKLGARLIFEWAEFEPDGELKITFTEAPRPRCESGEAIEENLRFLRRARDKKFQELGLIEGAAADQVAEITQRRALA